MSAEELAGVPAGIDLNYAYSAWSPVIDCDHPKNALHVAHFEATSATEWVCQVLCTQCLAVFHEDTVPNRVLGKIWLRQYEGRYGVVGDDPATREQVSRNVANARSEMIAMIKLLGVDPNDPDRQ